MSASAMQKTYNAFKGGTAPGSLKAIFLDELEYCLEEDRWQNNCDDICSRNKKLRRLTGLFWNCTDRIPTDIAFQIDAFRLDLTVEHEYHMQHGLSYAQGARIIRGWLDRMEEYAFRRDNDSWFIKPEDYERLSQSMQRILSENSTPV